MSEDNKPLPVSSSTPPDFPAEQVRLFREVLELMNRREIPYVVSGAFALQQHTGIWRNTKDLDLFLPAEEVATALEALANDGFLTEVADPVWLAKAHRGEFFVDLITGMSNGIVTVDRSWIQRGALSEVVGVPVRVLGAEELFASKLFVTRRERFDGADLCHIIHGRRGKLDWQRIIDLIGEEHWGLLLWALLLFAYVYPAHIGYVPRNLWDDLLGRLRKQLDEPGPAEFRGSLVDPNMFAIDIEEWRMEDLGERQRALRLLNIERQPGE